MVPCSVYLNMFDHYLLDRLDKTTLRPLIRVRLSTANRALTVRSRYRQSGEQIDSLTWRDARTAFVGLVVGALLVGGTPLAGAAYAAPPIYRYGAVACSTNVPSRSVACSRLDTRGYVVGIGRQAIAVQAPDKRFVLFRKNTGGKAGKIQLGKRQFSYGGVRCGSPKPGLVVCARIDHIGYAVTISRKMVAVIRLSDMRRISYRPNSPVI